MNRTKLMPRKKNPTRDRLDVRIEPELARKATQRAKELGMNISAYIRMLMALDLERIEKERRESQ